MNPPARCAYCGSTKDLAFFGNPPDAFMVKIGAWGAGEWVCRRCCSVENRRALRRKTSPRWTARILRYLRTRGRRP